MVGIQCNERRGFRDLFTFEWHTAMKISQNKLMYRSHTLQVLLSGICDHFFVKLLFTLVQLQPVIEKMLEYFSPYLFSVSVEPWW